jgi:hypothetical protein
MASRRDSVALIRRYLLISVILVTIPLLLVWRFLEDAQVAIVATVRAVPLTALTALARATNGDKPEDGQLDSAGVQLDAGDAVISRRCRRLRRRRHPDHLPQPPIGGLSPDPVSTHA